MGTLAALEIARAAARENGTIRLTDKKRFDLAGWLAKQVMRNASFDSVEQLIEVARKELGFDFTVNNLRALSKATGTRLPVRRKQWGESNGRDPSTRGFAGAGGKPGRIAGSLNVKTVDRITALETRLAGLEARIAKIES